MGKGRRRRRGGRVKGGRERHRGKRGWKRGSCFGGGWNGGFGRGSV